MGVVGEAGVTQVTTTSLHDSRVTHLPMVCMGI